MLPAISTIAMLTLFARRQRTNVSVLYQFVDTAKRPWPTSVARGGAFPGRAARGSVVPRKDGLPSYRGGRLSLRFKAINSRTGRGSLIAAPF